MVAAAVAALFAIPSTGRVAAQDPVLTIDWTATRPASGEVVDGNVRLDGGASGRVLPLVDIDVPDLGRAGYSIHGRVRYTDVAGTGYLEMWSNFADGGRYFTRTLAASGPMAALTGTSDWRPFELPFFLEGAATPTRLEVNAVLPGKGSVEIGPLELIRLAGPAGEAWVPDRAVGVIGALLGTATGLLGGLIGVLVSRNRGRRLVLPAMTAATVGGVALVVGAVIAVGAGQPANVVLLLLVPGAVLATAFGVALPAVRRAYAQAELRRMRAMDQA